MDCYGHLPSENRFGISHYNRFSETPSPINSFNNRVSSPGYMVKPSIENTITSLNHQRNDSPIRFPSHLYPPPLPPPPPPPSYRMSPNISLSGPPTAPLNYYRSSFDPNGSRNYLPTRTINTCSSSINDYKDSLEKINGYGTDPIEEYYRNSHYNYQQSFNNYGKLSVPKNSYFNHHHSGLPPHHRTPYLQGPGSYPPPSPRNDYYDPIAGLHQAVRNGFKDNIGLSNTYHNIYNYSPPLLPTHLKKPHIPHPTYGHPHQSIFPSSYPNYSAYDIKPTNFDYYRSHYPVLSSYPDYQNSTSAQQYLYQQQQQQHQQYLANKHHIQQQNYYHDYYTSPMTQLELGHSPKLPSLLDDSKRNEINSENRLQSLINEELCSMSSNIMEVSNKISNNERQNHSNSLEDVPLELNKNNNNDKTEQRAESSVSETNTSVNDVNSETTAASSPLTSVSSYTDSGISGCSNNIDGSNASDGGSIEDKNDENNINQMNSNNLEVQNEAEKQIEIKINNEEFDESDESKTGKSENENDSNSKMKKCAVVVPSNTSPRESKTIFEKGNQFERVIKPFSEHCLSNRFHPDRCDYDHHQIQTSSPYNENYNKFSSQTISSKGNLSRYQNNYNTVPSKGNNILQSKYHNKSHTGNWSSYHYESRTKLQSFINHDDYSLAHTNSKYKNNVKTNPILTNISKNRVLECDLIPSKKSRKKTDPDTLPNDSIEFREEIKDIKPLPAFQQAFGSTEIGRFSEIFLNNSPDSSYNCSTPYDYHSMDNDSPYPWETGDSLEGPPYNNFYRPSSIYSKTHLENFDIVESSKENYFNSFD